MEHEMGNAYGLWSLVILNSFIFIIFAFSFFKPKTKRDWRSFGAFSAFLVALFTEMYGFPLTIYLLSGWLQTNYSNIDWLAHDSGHLLEMLFGWEVNPHFGPFHIASFIFIGGGFWALAAAWPVLYKAQKESKLAVTGIYAKVRHPQYIGFIAIMFGFLLQWPTIPTLVLFPILTYMYVRLAKIEEVDARTEFGKAYDDYATHVPAFIPGFLSPQTNHKGEQL
jgi:methanethiol S-methyltransferase